MDGAFLDWALAEFSGYIAVDELYEGPYCVLSVVDNRQYKRLMYEGLDHAPSYADITAFLERLKAALDERGLSVKGVTTDGSALYPQPLREVFGAAVPHQLCQFHVVAELVKAVLRAVAAERQRLAKSKPKLKRGRPASKDKAAQRAARKRKRIQEKSGDLFRHRYLFIQRRLSAREHQTLRRITRGLPHLRKLREIMEEVYKLFDRRCRMETALRKLTQLRHWVKRFQWVGQTLQKLFSPTLEKALVFLDDKLLPSTSNAVERGNRRHRKMQQSIYRVRGQARLAARIALDMLREARAHARQQTTDSLHDARAG
jgi:hypothetical protein